jgi:hypothetical protein
MRKAARFAALMSLALGHIQAGEWTAPVEVRHDVTRCLTYQAKLSGGFLLVRATVDPGWHTFAMDNKQRAEEKLAGRKSLGIDQPTQITLSKGLKLAGTWLQSPPKDFSKPELQWFSWGFEKQAIFAAKVLRSGAGTALIGIRGQACTDTICKNIDIEISLSLASSTGRLEIDPKTLVPVRFQ